MGGERRAQGLTHHQDGGGRRWPRWTAYERPKSYSSPSSRMWMQEGELESGHLGGGHSLHTRSPARDAPANPSVTRGGQMAPQPRGPLLLRLNLQNRRNSRQAEELSSSCVHRTSIHCCTSCHRSLHTTLVHVVLSKQCRGTSGSWRASTCRQGS